MLLYVVERAVVAGLLLAESLFFFVFRPGLRSWRWILQ
jgi:hypothetical protein